VSPCRCEPLRAGCWRGCGEAVTDAVKPTTAAVVPTFAEVLAPDGGDMKEGPAAPACAVVSEAPAPMEGERK